MNRFGRDGDNGWRKASDDSRYAAPQEMVGSDAKSQRWTRQCVGRCEMCRACACRTFAQQEDLGGGFD